MTAAETKGRVLDAAHAVQENAAEAATAAGKAASAAGKAAEAVGNQAPEVIRAFRVGIDDLAERLPDAAAAARAGAMATSESLRAMPEPTLRLLAALSIGLGTGLYLAGAPRLATLVAFTPAVLAAVVIGFGDPRRSTSRR